MSRLIGVLKEYNRVLGATIGTKGVGEKRLRELYDLGYLPLQVRAVPEGTENQHQSSAN